MSVSLWAIALDVTLWPVLILGAGRWVETLPLSALDPDAWLYRLRAWEHGGRVYEKLGVRRWKGWLPDGAALWQDGFRKKQLAAADGAYLGRFVHETCRAELVHWLMVPMWGLFWLWNEPVAMAVMGVGVLVANAPPVILQRYNRGRLQAVLRRGKVGRTG